MSSTTWRAAATRPSGTSIFPPIVPLLARLETGLLGVAPWTLRLLPALLSGVNAVLSGAYVRKLGGSLKLQALGLLVGVTAPLIVGTWLFQTVIFEFQGFTVILIHHVGAKSGVERVNPLVCYPMSDDEFAVMASNGGAVTNPDWYYNLKAYPKITVELGTAVFAVAARELEGRERETVWARALNPQLGEAQQRTTRTFPILLLTRIP